MTILRAVSIVAIVIVVGIVASAFYVFYDSSMHAEDRGAPSGPATPALIERGEYLVRAADCVACHTAPGGKPFAGGLYMPTPFGEISVPNITPDTQTGIGAWSDDEFYRAMHD